MAFGPETGSTRAVVRLESQAWYSANSSDSPSLAFLPDIVDDPQPQPNDDHSGGHAGPLAVVALVTLVVFAPVTTFEFVDCDDAVHVAGNRHLLPPSLEGVAWFWSNPYRGLYIPLAYTFFAGEAQLALNNTARDGLPQVSPAMFHTGSLLLHVVCSCLVYLLLARLVRNRWAAVAGALLFALHPLQVESVAWVSITPGLLATSFSLLALWQYTIYCQHEDASQAGGSDRVRFAIATLALVAALLCKPTAAAVPLVAACLRFGWLGRPLRSGWVGLGLWFALVVLAAGVAKSIQTDSDIRGLSAAWQRPLIATDAIAFYGYKLLLPLGLTLDYGRSPARVAEHGWLYYTWVLPAGIAVALWWGRAGRPWWTAFAIFLAGLTPVLGLLPFGYQQTSTVADRYVYLAMLGPALAVAWWLASTPSRTPRRIVIGGLVFLAALSFQQARVWHDSLRLAEHGLQVNPKSYLLHMVRGEARERQEQSTLALQDFQTAVHLAPELPAAHERVGHALLKHNKPILASEAFQKAIDIEPRYLAAYNGLGLAYTRQGRFDNAVAAFQAALAIREDSAATHNNLGEAYRLAGDQKAALREYRQAVELDPTLANAQNNLGLALVAEGRLDAAVEHYRQALQRLPNSAELHNSLGAIYFQQQQWEAARDEFARALELRPGFREAEANLAAVQAQLGR